MYDPVLDLTNIRDLDLHELDLQFDGLTRVLCELQTGRDIAAERVSLLAKVAGLQDELS